MARLSVRNVPQSLHEALKQQARRNHRSISAETISILEQAVPTKAILRRRAGLVARVLKIQNMGNTGVRGPSTEAMLREDRER